MKTFLQKIIQPHLKNFEEFNSVLTSVEATLNSRPLLHLNATSTDGITSLSPGYFLVGLSLKALPTSGDYETNLSLLKCWNLVQRLSHDLWHQCMTSYLHTLQARDIWRMSSPSIQTGDVVVLKDESFLQGTWTLALVMKTYPGKDGLVRVVDVRGKGKVFYSPIRILVKLVSHFPSVAPEGYLGL